MSTRANEPMVFGATSEEPCMCGLFACFGDIWMKKPMTGGIDGQVQTRTVGEGIAESGSNRILPDERISSQVLGVGGSTLMVRDHWFFHSIPHVWMWPCSCGFRQLASRAEQRDMNTTDHGRFAFLDQHFA